ncbi:MAG: hypothetical protein JSV84_07850 [Gemmatimonadota bacterium]|nr:MAG: hypothetical protein JSV84_07850 [Gemmatimonadota bacterium]
MKKTKNGVRKVPFCKKPLIIIALILSVSLLRGKSSPGDQVQAVHIVFSYDNPEADSIFVAGSFNGWIPDLRMEKDPNGRWSVSAMLSTGYYYYKFVVDGEWIPDPDNPVRVNDGGDGFNSILKVGDPATPERKVGELGPLPVEKLPRPVLDGNPEWVDLYYAAWQMAWEKISFGSPDNGFVDRFMDEGFNEMIFQWDTVFMTMFGMYARHLFPVMPSLDNFYRKQRDDGYIQRVYYEENGEEVDLPTPEEPVVNPPLFAWAELRYVLLSGDTSRVRSILPVLIKYYDWIDGNCRDRHGYGLYYTTDLGCGMDNAPRPDIDQAIWIDFSAQQALAARSIARLGELIGDDEIRDAFENHFTRIAADINRLCWDPSRRFYFDRTRHDTLCSSKHIGAFWTLLSGVATEPRAIRMVEHLQNPAEFWRQHLVPTLSADHPDYDPRGHYWRGSVWAPTNYMVVRGLEGYGYRDVAADIAENHIGMMDRILREFSPDEDKIAFEERYGDGYHTIWECYSPDYPEPATRWDNTFYSRQDFVGWSGLGPIAMLIETVMGIELDGLRNTVRWRLRRLDRHGVEHVRLGDQWITLLCRARSSASDPARLDIESEKGFLLKVTIGERTYARMASAGQTTVKIE